MATALAPGHQAAGHSNLHRVWEIVTILITIALLIMLIGTYSPEFAPTRRLLLEGTLHCEKIFGTVAPVILFLGRKWVWNSEIGIFIVAWGGACFQHLSGYFRRLCQCVGWTFIGLLLVCAAGEFLEWRDHGLPSPMDAKFYRVAGGTVELFRASDGTRLCTLPRGTRIENLRVRASAAFNPDDLVVRAETDTCPGWDIPLYPHGVIKAADFGRLSKV